MKPSDWIYERYRLYRRNGYEPSYASRQALIDYLDDQWLKNQLKSPEEYKNNQEK